MLTALAVAEALEWRAASRQAARAARREAGAARDAETKRQQLLAQVDMAVQAAIEGVHDVADVPSETVEAAAAVTSTAPLAVSQLLQPAEPAEQMTHHTPAEFELQRRVAFLEAAISALERQISGSAASAGAAVPPVEPAVSTPLPLQVENAAQHSSASASAGECR